MEDYFIIGVPGVDADQAWQTAKSILNKPNLHDRDYVLWENKTLADFDTANKMVCATKLNDYHTKTRTVYCWRYKNADDIIEFLFFGWLFR